MSNSQGSRVTYKRIPPPVRIRLGAYLLDCIKEKKEITVRDALKWAKENGLTMEDHWPKMIAKEAGYTFKDSPRRCGDSRKRPRYALILAQIIRALYDECGVAHPRALDMACRNQMMDEMTVADAYPPGKAPKGSEATPLFPRDDE